MAKKCFTWSQLNKKWSAVKYKWNDVCILIKAGGGGILLSDPHIRKKKLPTAEEAQHRLTKEEYKHFIELVCRVNGISSKAIKERKDNGQIDVTVFEIETLYEDVSKSIKLNGITREDI